MLKWYEETGENSDIVISSRIRLARNLQKYPFSPKLTEEQANQLYEEVVEKLPTLGDTSSNFQHCNILKLGDVEKTALVERHIISPGLAAKKQCTGIILSEDEKVSMMINEEDHIRLQVFAGGMNMGSLLRKANEIDDLAYDALKFAYDEKLGYLTSCPTNVGTGLRASYMIYLPALFATGKIEKLIDEVSKYGVTLRGIYGEGSKSIANIFQLSNQKTLGATEHDIIENLNNIVLQVIKQERKRREYMLSQNYDMIEDQVYRSYGILKYTKQISTSDAMTLLSQVKFGIDTGIIKFSLNQSIYQLMIEIQPANLQQMLGKTAGTKDRERARAKYLNEHLPELK
ncbi:MAG TPA: protein arginine kinase [Lachnospiraceae bacterium]|nr:protein arginine kinase [Lachnospiraceae bacterium]